MPYHEIIRYDNKTGKQEYKIKVFGSLALAEAIARGVCGGVEPKEKRLRTDGAVFTVSPENRAELWSFSKFSLALFSWRV